MAPKRNYLQIAESLRQMIVDGRLRPGSLIPSELALAEQFGVARGTVRRALAILVDEGKIAVVPGRGRRVAGVNDDLADVAWGQVATSLRKALDAGRFSVDVPMPSEVELMAEFQVSRNTVRRAYRYLVDEGLVVVKHGAGAFPAPR